MKTKYLKCSCGSDEWIRTERRAIVKIQRNKDGDIDEEIDSLVFPSYTYECGSCGNTDI